MDPRGPSRICHSRASARRPSPLDTGTAAIDNLMEDAATAEISRSQLWHWRTHGVALTDGRVFDEALYTSIRDEELARLGGAAEGRLSEAAGLLDRLVLDDDFAEFLTLRAYSLLE